MFVKLPLAMRTLRRFLSISFNIVSLMGFLMSFVVVFGVIFYSYQFIGQVADSSQLSETGKSLLKLSQKLHGFNAVDAIEKDMAQESVPSLCKILCDPANFDFNAALGPAQENPLLYFEEFYKQQRRRAFADPKFRLALETASAYSELVPSSARQTLSEIGRVSSDAGAMSEFDKWILSVKLPVAVLKAGAEVVTRLEDSQARANRASEMNQLRKDCAFKKAQDVIRECVSL